MNLKETLLDLDGKPIKNGEEDLTVGRALAEILVRAKSTDPLRSYLLGRKLVESETLEPDKAEKEFIQNTIRSFEGYSVLIKGQLLEKFI